MTMIALTNPDDVQQYIRRLEASLREEQAARLAIEASAKKKDIYISFIDSFVLTIGKKLGVTRRSREALTDIDRAIDVLLTRK